MTKHLECPIGHEIMQDPVMGSDGYTYEREKIEEWLKKNHRSPMTRDYMTAGSLRTNQTVKSIINLYFEIQKQQDARKKQDENKGE